MDDQNEDKDDEMTDETVGPLETRSIDGAAIGGGTGRAFEIPEIPEGSGATYAGVITLGGQVSMNQCVSGVNPVLNISGGNPEPEASADEPEAQ